MAMSDRASIVCPGRSTRARKRPREFACAGSRGSTSFTISTSWRTTVEEFARFAFVRSIVTRVLPVSTSRVTSQRGGSMPAESGVTSFGEEAKGGGVALPRSGTTGRTSREGVLAPRCTSFRPGWGVGHTFGKSALATATRMRWPRAKRQAVASIGMSGSTTSPAVSGSGSVSDHRRVAFSIPLAMR